MAVARRGRYGAALPRKAPLTGERIEHWAYTPTGAFEQEPVKVLAAF